MAFLQQFWRIFYEMSRLPPNSNGFGRLIRGNAVDDAATPTELVETSDPGRPEGSSLIRHATATALPDSGRARTRIAGDEIGSGKRVPRAL